ncbi:MAG: hypothetical protein ACFFDT_23115, partial [Candidatus Hodarchaeota archaeon]
MSPHQKLLYSLFLLICLSGVFFPAFFVSSQARKIDFVFVLHANQALVPYGDVANDLCYRGVLETLLDHPSIHVTLHISGTLLSVLSYYQRDTLDLIKQGINSGQFEILGSTYSQNVMYSHVEPGSANYTSAFFDNDIQLRLHREVIQAQLDVSPIGFWNPERVWDPDIIFPIIMNGSYEYTFIEDHIIGQISSSSPYLIRTTGSQDDLLYIFNDDKATITDVDVIAAPSGDPDPNSHTDTAIANFISHCNDLYNEDTNDEYAIVYAQDMEAWGLWQEESRSGWTDSLANVLFRLDSFLSALEDESSWLAVRTPSEILNDLNGRSYSFEHHDIIPFGEAVWMSEAAQVSGWDEWKTWQDTDSDLSSYRQSFALSRDILASINRKIFSQEQLGQNVTAARNLYHYAEYVYAANQFEFGCWGCKFWWYHRVKTALHAARAAEYALDPSSSIELLTKDIDLDGGTNTEYILQNTISRFVFTKRGGRLINWFDIENGLIIIANDAPTSYTHYSQQFNYIPNDASDFWGRSNKVFYMRYKAFVEFLETPRDHTLGNLNYDVYLETDNSLKFEIKKADYADIKKTFSLMSSDSANLTAHYEVLSRTSSPKDFIVGCGFSVNNTNLLVHGFDHVILERHMSSQISGVGNQASNTSVIFSSPKAVTIQNDSRHLFEEMILFNYGSVSTGDYLQFNISLSLV